MSFDKSQSETQIETQFETRSPSSSSIETKGGNAHSFRRTLADVAPKRASGNAPARIALLGCGSVGSEVAQRLIEDATSLNVKLVKVLVRNPKKDRAIDGQFFTDSLDEILAEKPDLVIEALGGLKPADEYVAACLKAGIPVVSANKTLLAHRLSSLKKIASESGAAIAYEAAVCSAIPVLAALRQFDADHVTSITAIVNGSCNYILSQMTKNRTTFDAALAKAAELGFVEPDPSADITGRDSAEKLCLLADAVGLKGITPDKVELAGIESVTDEDIKHAKASGHVIKLVAELDRSDEGLSLRVGPTLVARSHALASVEDEDNGVVIETTHAGELFLRGKGAGPGPTASAILGDVVRLLGADRSEKPKQIEPKPRARAPRQSQVRVRATNGPVNPRHVFDAIDASGAFAEELVLTRTGAVVRTCSPEGLAESLASTLESSPDVLVMPILVGADESPLQSSA